MDVRLKLSQSDITKPKIADHGTKSLIKKSILD